MALDYSNDYENNRDWQELLLIIDEHTQWFHSLLLCFYYPEQVVLLNSIKKPTSFDQFLVSTSNKKEISPENTEKIVSLHSEMLAIADALISKIVETKEKIEIEELNKFFSVYEEFMLYLRNQEKDAIKSGAGYDAFTGLRSKDVLYPDLERELHRLERQGKPFCIALIRINDFETIKNNMKFDDVNSYIKLVADFIKLSVRSFDDAYYTGEDEFILSLKQVKISGGVSALDRLKAELERQRVELKINGVPDMFLSLSCCIAEPVSGDGVHDLISNLRQDLCNAVVGDGDTVLKYVELSPLARLVQDGVTDR